jgi:hypothetical protein
MLAATVVTWPLTPKLRFACWAGSIVPVAETVWRIVPRLAVPNRGAAAADDPAQAHPVIATPAATTTALTISHRLVSIRRIAITGFITTPFR